jgi:hypothetical protein
MSFSIKQLLFLVVVIAVGLAGLANVRWPAVHMVIGLLSLAVLIIMAYGIWLATGERRAFCIGFVAWSLVYGLPFGGYVAPANLALELLNRAAPLFQPPPTSPPPSYSPLSTLPSTSPISPESPPWELIPNPNGDLLIPSSPAAPTLAPAFNQPALITEPDYEWQARYHTVGHCLIGILLGMLGGWVTVFIYRRRKRMPAP